MSWPSTISGSEPSASGSLAIGAKSANENAHINNSAIANRRVNEDGDRAISDSKAVDFENIGSWQSCQNDDVCAEGAQTDTED